MRYASLESVLARAKRAAFATPLFGVAVRRGRARRVENTYRRTAERYIGAPVPPFEDQLASRGGGRLAAFRQLERRPRVLLVGTTWAQDSGGLLRGLGAVADVVPFTKADGSYGQAIDDVRLSFDRAAEHSRRITDLAERARELGRPFDVVIGQMWGGYLNPAELRRLRSLGALVVNIGMDDRHTFETRKLGKTIGTRALTGVVDLVATAAPEAVRWFAAEGCPALFFPEASDPNVFWPGNPREKLHDVSFVGERYGIRRRLVEALETAGIAVAARGAGWPYGRIDTPGMARLFAQSRIVLGVGTIGQSEKLLALKLRDFDGPMSGSCYVTHDNPDLRLLYRVGEEIAVYADERQCVDIVRSLLADDDRRERVARAGRARACSTHTWEARFAYLFDVLRGLASPGRPPFLISGTM